MFVRFCYFTCSCFCRFVLIELSFGVVVVVLDSLFVFFIFSFLGYGGVGVEALIRRNTGILRGSCTLQSLLARVIENFFGLVGWGDAKLQLADVGKLNG